MENTTLTITSKFGSRNVACTVHTTLKGDVVYTFRSTLGLGAAKLQLQANYPLNRVEVKNTSICIFKK